MAEELVDQAQESAEGAGERFVSIAALMVAVIATFMALCGVKGDNMDYGILQEKSDAADMWNQYQSKSMKQYMYKLQCDTLEGMMLTSGTLAPAAQQALQAKLAKYKGEIDRYETEKEEISGKAKDHEANVARMNHVADLLDMTEVFLSLAISLLAITILTRRRWMMALSAVPAVIGIFFGLAALCSWPIQITLPAFLN
jgi:hypothetical protein